MEATTRTDRTPHQRTSGADDPPRYTRPSSREEGLPLVRHSSDLLDLVAEGVPFAVAHDVRASGPRRSSFPG